MMIKVFVTGATGYIGSHVARAFKLENPGNKVFVIDQVMREHTLKGLDGHLICDFIAEESLATIIDLQPDIIVHLAARTEVEQSFSEQITFSGTAFGGLSTSTIYYITEILSLYGEKSLSFVLFAK